MPASAFGPRILYSLHSGYRAECETSGLGCFATENLKDQPNDNFLRGRGHGPNNKPKHHENSRLGQSDQARMVDIVARVRSAGSRSFAVSLSAATGWPRKGESISVFMAAAGR